MIVEVSSVKLLGSTIGGMMSVMFSVAIQEHPGLIETATAGGLGAALSAVLVRWILAQYNRSVDRLTKLEDERAVMIRETVGALTKVTVEISELIAASHERGKEVSELISILKERPCIARKG